MAKFSRECDDTVDTDTILWILVDDKIYREPLSDSIRPVA